MIQMKVAKRVKGESWMLAGIIGFKDGKFTVESKEKSDKTRIERLLKGAKKDNDILSYINNGVRNEKKFKVKPEDKPVEFLRGIRKKTTPYLIRFGLVETDEKDLTGETITYE